MAQKIKSKEPVRLRRRRTSTGLESLYLDIYVDGVRQYEYLKLYLVPETGREEKEKNRQTLGLAEAIRAKRLLEVLNGKFGIRNQKEALFSDYFMSIAEGKKRHLSEPTIKAWHSAWRHVLIYDKRAATMTLREVSTEWINGFILYLQHDAVVHSGGWKTYEYSKQMRRNTMVHYLNCVKACMKQAYKEDYIERDVTKGIETISEEEGKREYLTIEEVQRLSATDCAYPFLKQAFLFSCLTGLRRSDIEALTWRDVQRNGGFTRIVFRQKKTCQQEYLDINAEAATLLGERGRDDEHVFHLECPDATNYHLRDWCMAAGISKHLTFHCGRHTFATMLLTLGTDIYTVSKLLGHKSIQTTQIYAKVIDKRKQEAVCGIPSILGGDGTKGGG